MKSSFVWYELMTTDVDAAASFYGAVVGWGLTRSSQPGMEYHMFNVGGDPVGGLMALPEEAAAAGTPVGWHGYVSVADVDQTLAEFEKADGNTLVPPMDVPGVGRFAMVADPQGAGLYVFAQAEPGPGSFRPGKLGYGGWHELHAKDGQAAIDFYSAQFGWCKVDEMDMGEMGRYQMFSFDGSASGERDMAGGIYTDSQAAHPYWLIYFNVGNIDEAAETLTANGGEVIVGPIQVPGDEWVLEARDPQGGAFALVGSRS